MKLIYEVRFFIFIAYIYSAESSTFIRSPQCAELIQPNFTFKHGNCVRTSPVKNIHDLRDIGFDTNRISKNVLSATFMTVPELIWSNGYPAEIHKVTTNDGYILEMHRIPGSPKSPHTNSTKIPVLVMHGLMESSAGWVVMGPEKGLAFILADAGYDVWLGNARGSRYSKHHIKYKPTGLNKSKFWSFSWHEIGVFDLPAQIGHILATTNANALHYIGHSQGTTAFFVMASKYPAFNKKVLSMNALAPVATLNHLGKESLIQMLVKFYVPLKKALHLLDVHEFSLDNKFLSTISKHACKSTDSFLCRNVLFLLDGAESKHINCTMVPVIFGHTPAGAATQQLIHYAQLVRSGKFQLFDFESALRNMKEYGHAKPPQYDIASIKVPIYLHYSQADVTATKADVLELKKRLSNVRGVYELSDFTHVDFVYSVTVKEIVYDKIVRILKGIDSTR